MRRQDWPGWVSAGLAGWGREFGFVAVGRVLLVYDLGDLEQPITGGIGGDRVGEPVVYPIECTDAVLLAKLELRLADDIDHKIITPEAPAFTVVVHQECGGPAPGAPPPAPP